MNEAQHKPPARVTTSIKNILKTPYTTPSTHGNFTDMTYNSVFTDFTNFRYLEH
jgi:hypothetical protein